MVQAKEKLANIFTTLNRSAYTFASRINLNTDPPKHKT